MVNTMVRPNRRLKKVNRTKVGMRLLAILKLLPRVRVLNARQPLWHGHLRALMTWR